MQWLVGIPTWPHLTVYESTVVAKKKAPSSVIFIPSPSQSRELKMIVGSGNDVLAPPLSGIVASVSVSVSYLIKVDAFEDLHKKRLAVLAKTIRNICC